MKKDTYAVSWLFGAFELSLLKAMRANQVVVNE